MSNGSKRVASKQKRRVCRAQTQSVRTYRRYAPDARSNSSHRTSRASTLCFTLLPACAIESASTTIPSSHRRQEIGYHCCYPHSCNNNNDTIHTVNSLTSTPPDPLGTYKMPSLATVCPKVTTLNASHSPSTSVAPSTVRPGELVAIRMIFMIRFEHASPRPKRLVSLCPDLCHLPHCSACSASCTRPCPSLCHSLYQVRLQATAIDKTPQRVSALQTRACQQKIRNIPGRSEVLVSKGLKPIHMLDAVLLPPMCDVMPPPLPVERDRHPSSHHFLAYSPHSAGHGCCFYCGFTLFDSSWYKTHALERARQASEEQIYTIARLQRVLFHALY